jgi:glycogen phosphorylase
VRQSTTEPGQNRKIVPLDACYFSVCLLQYAPLHGMIHDARPIMLRVEESVKFLGQVEVHPTPAEPIGRLTELAYNLWWSWHAEAQALYAEIDPVLWKAANHNPVKFLRQVSQHQLDRAAADSAYLTRYSAVMAAYDAYMHPDSTWWSRTYPELHDSLIAYFSAEFGLHEALPIYSGGLGVLAGDHCKEASDLGLPFVAVGFLYPQGYFQQRIDRDGRQQAIYEKIDFTNVPARPALGADGREIIISVDLPGRVVYAKLWRIQVGRIPIYLMDTDVEANDPADRELAARLYGGNQEIRISQEVVLGIGGVRTLRALQLQPTVWHMNEGHAAFLQLERIREFVEEQGLDYSSAVWAARSDAVFTTHTPVPAGNDAFPYALMERFFGSYWGRLGLDRDRFLDMGRYDYSWGPQFSMTVLALRTAGRANGVSKLHGAISRRMWRGMWPDIPLAEVPIGSVTNGVHTDTWLDPGLAALLDRYLGPGWRGRLDEPGTWNGVWQIPDADLAAQHRSARLALIQLVRERLGEHLRRVKAPGAEIGAAAQVLNPDALTIGFARRFATYKRAALIFRDQDRIARLLNNPERPVQIIFAGKAHPADEPGKALIQFVYQMGRQPQFAGKVLFVEDYDINLARRLVAGVDIWLNTPRRPLEASGTSGQKAGLNGILNLSVLDGWWPEAIDGRNGWAVGSEQAYADENLQDEIDAESLYASLENEIVPLFYAFGNELFSHAWLDKRRASMATVGPQFSLARMLKQYVTEYYIPASAAGEQLRAGSFTTARDLAAWQALVQQEWPAVRLSATPAAVRDLKVGEPWRVQAELRLGRLSVDDVAVELVYGQASDGDLMEAHSARMQPVSSSDGVVLLQGEIASPESGSFVYGVRARPAHPGLQQPFAIPLITWA